MVEPWGFTMGNPSDLIDLREGLRRQGGIADEGELVAWIRGAQIRTESITWAPWRPCGPNIEGLETKQHGGCP